MIAKTIDENSVSVIAEDSDDLLILRRIIRQDDRITGDTTRVLKQERDYARPDKGERIKVRVAVTVEKISLDGVLERLRIGGTISESSSEHVPHGSHHSLLVKIGDAITISKRWSRLEKSLLRPQKSEGIVLVAIDVADCGIARLVGTHLEFMPNIYSGSGGKRYKTSFDVTKYFDQVCRALESALSKGDRMVLFGPGQTKKKFANHLQGTKSVQGVEIVTVEGIDSGGEDGIYTFTRSDAMKEAISESKLARVSAIIDQIMVLASKKSSKFTMGLAETRNASQMGAVESLVFSEKAIQDNDEQQVIDFLNDAEKGGAKIYGVDSTTDIGMRVTGLGGIVSLLRYPIGSAN